MRDSLKLMLSGDGHPTAIIMDETLTGFADHRHQNFVLRFWVDAFI